MISVSRVLSLSRFPGQRTGAEDDEGRQQSATEKRAAGREPRRLPDSPSRLHAGDTDAPPLSPAPPLRAIPKSSHGPVG
jgi:hypothetical protein